MTIPLPQRILLVLMIAASCVLPAPVRASGPAQESGGEQKKPAGASGSQGGQDPAKPAEAAPGKAPAATAKEGAGDKLPAGVLARVNGIDISVEDYSRYLLASIGKTKLRELVDRVLVEQLAGKLNVEVSPEDVERRVEEQIESRVRVLFQGDRSRFEKVHLAGLGMTLDEYRDFQAQKLAFDLLLERCILARRTITEEDIRRRFEEVYGPGGVRYELRHILIGRLGLRSKGSPAKRPSEEEARKKAESVLKKIQDGAEFVDMVREYSEDLLSKRNDGKIPVYRPGLYGDEFHRAVLALSESHRLSGVVRSQRGFHIIYFLGKTETKLEDRREEIVAFLKKKPPGAKEKQDLLRELRAEAKIQY